MVLSNDPTEQKLQTMELLYASLAFGQLGYMDGQIEETGEIVPLLIGLQPTEDGNFRIYPIAQLFSKQDKLVDYLVPDGTGSYRKIPTGTPVNLIGSTDQEESGPPEGFDKTKLN
jgi:hypothetical protein